MKTPDEIKKGLEWCQLQDGHIYTDCPHCPYYLTSSHCDMKLHADVLAYIQQLERERDALLNALKKADWYGECENCKHRDSAPSDCDFECGSCQRNCRCWECRDGDKWEWVGVKEDDK